MNTNTGTYLDITGLSNLIDIDTVVETYVAGSEGHAKDIIAKASAQHALYELTSYNVKKKTTKDDEYFIVKISKKMRVGGDADEY